MKTQQKELKNQLTIYSNCVKFINECRRIIKNCNTNYKNSFKSNLKYFKTNEHLINYRDNTLNRLLHYKSILNVNLENKKKYDELITSMCNNLVYYEILLNK